MRKFYPNQLAAYGMLRPDAPQTAPTPLMAGLRHMGSCKIKAHLLDLGSYPGVVPGPERVICARMLVTDDHVWEALDRFEGFDPGDPDGSRYRRLRTPLVDDNSDVWVYWWNTANTPQLDEHRIIASGDWVRR